MRHLLIHMWGIYYAKTVTCGYTEMKSKEVSYDYFPAISGKLY